MANPYGVITKTPKTENAAPVAFKFGFYIEAFIFNILKTYIKAKHKIFIIKYNFNYALYANVYPKMR